MVKVSDEAVRKAMQQTVMAQQGLVRNLNMMRESVQKSLLDWNDTNVLQFLNVFRDQCAAITQLSQNLEQIHEFCNDTLRWMNAYLN